MSHPFFIRPLLPADALAYRALRLRALQAHPQAFTTSFEEAQRQPLEASERRLAAAPEHRFWGAAWRHAEPGTQLVGMVGLEREARANTRHKATVVGLYVQAEHAGQGLARALMQALLAQAQQDGIESLVLTVTQGNAAATALYESLGFKTFGVEPDAVRLGSVHLSKQHMVWHLPLRHGAALAPSLASV